MLKTLRTIFSIVLLSFILRDDVFSQSVETIRAKDSILSVGETAPTFYLKYLDGSEFYSRDYFGNPRDMAKARAERNNVVMSFFATYCVPCRKEIPELEKLQEKYPDIKFLLIDVNEKKEKVDAHLLTMPIKIPILLDRYGKISEMYNVKDNGNALAVLPTLVLISKDGLIHFYKKGYHDGDELKIEDEIKKFKP